MRYSAPGSWNSYTDEFGAVRRKVNFHHEGKKKKNLTTKYALSKVEGGTKVTK